MGGPRRHHVDLAEQGADDQRGDRSHRRGVEQWTSGSAQVAVAVSQDEDEGRVEDARRDAEHRPEDRRIAVGVAADHPRDQHDADQDDGHRGQCCPMRPLTQERPCGKTHDGHLGVAQHGCQAGADRLDGVVPRHQIRREEQPGDHREAVLGPGPWAVAAALAQHEQRQRGDRVRAPEDRSSRGRDVGVAHQDRGERDGERAEHPRDVGQAGGGGGLLWHGRGSRYRRPRDRRIPDNRHAAAATRGRRAAPRAARRQRR